MWEYLESRHPRQGQIDGTLWLCQGKRIFASLTLVLSLKDGCDPGDPGGGVLKTVLDFLAAESWSYSPVAVHRLLITVASLVAEHGLQGRQASVGTQA